ncbi:potassium-transporting ATPase subunit KdpC [uncultured Megasphaera sp.]|uniref:potassium-transporting ATPase subunit KdpC n=1 Tax=uncultured Megasphaera sp. TaxID=165188 RepID=UPI002657D391|nr:potassium-transporting ATPase subunit KdpC [uncultured Megasphaera sp.]
MRIFRTALLQVIFFTVFCGFIYTVVMTGIAQALFPSTANGSMIEVNGVKYGSALLGQNFSSNRHMWGRITNVDVSTYTDKDGNALAYGIPSNLSPASEDYQKLISERIEKIHKANPEQGDKPIPVDLVTNSGSGLDPDISLAAAQYQVPRLARENNMSEDAVNKIIAACTNPKTLGFFGETTVNVLKVNLMLDGVLSPQG